MVGGHARWMWENWLAVDEPFLIKIGRTWSSLGGFGYEGLPVVLPRLVRTLSLEGLRRGVGEYFPKGFLLLDFF